MHNDSCGFGALFAFILANVCLFFGIYLGIDQVRKEAVKEGAAHYVNSDDGSPKFEWITNK